MSLSESRRKSVNDWYDNTLTSRLNNKNTGCIILVMQRLHQDDLGGHVLAQGEWEVVSFPAIAEQDEEHRIDSPLGSKLYRRKKGDVLDVTRESLKTLNHIRESTGTYNFQSQYQQNPMPAEGNMVKTGWLHFYEPRELLEEFSCVLQSWDTANKPGELNDYSVCTTWGVLNKDYYLLDVWRARVDYPGLKRAVQQQAELHNPHIISIEDKASGTQLIQELRTEGLYKAQGQKPWLSRVPTGHHLRC